MNYLDVFFLTVIAIITIRGLFRGLITELMVLVALVMGFITATLFHAQLEGYLVASFESLPAAAAKVIAFVAIFIGVNVFFRILASVLNKVATFTFLQPVNKVAGSVFAFIKTALFLSILIIVIEFIPGGTTALNAVGREESRIYKPVRGFAPFIYDTFLSSGEDSFEKIMPDLDSVSAEKARDLLPK